MWYAMTSGTSGQAVQRVLTLTRWADQQATLGDACADCCEALRALQELHNLHEVLLGLLNTCVCVWWGRMCVCGGGGEKTYSLQSDKATAAPTGSMDTWIEYGTWTEPLPCVQDWDVPWCS